MEAECSQGQTPGLCSIAVYKDIYLLLLKYLKLLYFSFSKIEVVCISAFNYFVKIKFIRNFNEIC